MSENVFLPRAGELVVATIKRIVPYGAYATLDEYGDAEGLLHISEVSSRWVRNIRNHVRERQKTVLKVLRVNAAKMHINLSLRRVTEREKRERLLQWKHERRARRLFSMAAENLGIDHEDAMTKVGRLLEDRFGSLYAGFESASVKGEDALTEANIPSNWAEAIAEIAEARVTIPLKTVKGVLEVTCSRPNGVDVLKDAFEKATNIETSENAEIAISTIGAPRYRIEVVAPNYKEAEKLLAQAVTMASVTVEASGGESGFTRE